MRNYQSGLENAKNKKLRSQQSFTSGRRVA